MGFIHHLNIGLSVSCLTLASLPTTLYAQTNGQEKATEQEEVIYDGVGTTTNCATMHKGRWQVETSSGVVRQRQDDGRWGSEWLLNAMQLRYGVGRRCELQMEVDQTLLKMPGEGGSYGLSLLAAGTKIMLTEGSSSWPASTIHARLFLPGSDDSEFLPHHAGGMIHLLMHSDICSWYDIDYLAGPEWEGCSRKPAWYMGLCNNFPVGERLTLMVLSHNTLANRKWSNAIQAEASYLVGRRVMLDVAGTFDLNSFGDTWDAMLTVAWLVGRR